MTAVNRSHKCVLCVLILVAASGICPAQHVKEKKVALTRGAAVAEKSSPRLAVMIAQWTRAKAWTGEYIDKMPEDSLGFRPVPGVRTFAGQMLHLAYWNFGFVDRAIGQTAPYKEQDLMNDEAKGKAWLNKVVAESYDFVINGLKGLTDSQLDEQLTMRNGAKVPRIERLNDAYEHQTHHRGQTVIYLRLKGLTPPGEPF